MVKEPKSQFRPDDGNHFLAYEIAEKHCSVAMSVIDAAGVTSESAQAYALSNFELVFMSAANMGLAIELQLKSLLMQCNILPPKTHELPELYSKLPPPLKSGIENSYAELLKQKENDGSPIAFVMRIGRDKEPDKRAPAYPAVEGVRSLLMRASGAYGTWRHVLTTDTKVLENPIIYEFHRLGCLFRALQVHAKYTPKDERPAKVVEPEEEETHWLNMIVHERPPKLVKVTKLDIALENLDTSLKCFMHEKAYISSLHCAGAAEEILGRYIESYGEDSSFTMSSKLWAMIAWFSRGAEGDLPDKRKLAEALNQGKNSVKHMDDIADGSAMIDAELDAERKLENCVIDLCRLAVLMNFDIPPARLALVNEFISRSQRLKVRALKPLGFYLS